jgi:hypothetical protein
LPREIDRNWSTGSHISQCHERTKIDVVGRPARQELPATYWSHSRSGRPLIYFIFLKPTLLFYFLDKWTAALQGMSTASLTPSQRKMKFLILKSITHNLDLVDEILMHLQSTEKQYINVSFFWLNV